MGLLCCVWPQRHLSSASNRRIVALTEGNVIVSSLTTLHVHTSRITLLSLHNTLILHHNTIHIAPSTPHHTTTHSHITYTLRILLTEPDLTGPDLVSRTQCCTNRPTLVLPCGYHANTEHYINISISIHKTKQNNTKLWHACHRWVGIPSFEEPCL